MTQHDHDDDDKPHVHEPLYRAVSMIGALMCLRCGGYISGLKDDLAMHDKFHEEIELALNGGAAKKQKGKKK